MERGGAGGGELGRSGRPGDGWTACSMAVAMGEMESRRRGGGAWRGDGGGEGRGDGVRGRRQRMAGDGALGQFCSRPAQQGRQPAAPPSPSGAARQFSHPCRPPETDPRGARRAVWRGPLQAAGFVSSQQRAAQRKALPRVQLPPVREHTKRVSVTTWLQRVTGGGCAAEGAGRWAPALFRVDAPPHRRSQRGARARATLHSRSRAAGGGPQARARWAGDGWRPQARWACAGSGAPTSHVQFRAARGG